jgi:hypothetical protein
VVSDAARQRVLRKLLARDLHQRLSAATTPDTPSLPRCPACGGTHTVHGRVRGMVNEIRAGMGLPSLDPPDTDTDAEQ